MKIARIRFAGFRGARAEVSLDFPSGFVVVVGRNGTGKSTICDAIEYALTGDLRPDSAHTEKSERLSDYLWWRGGGPTPPADRFVELVLVDSQGAEHHIRRTPTDSPVLPHGLDALLCRTPGALEGPLVQLCRTAILRDEDITRLSVDLKEGDRFEAVRSALGTADFSATEARAEEVISLLKKEQDRRNVQYSSANERVDGLTTTLTHARTDASQSGGLTDAQHTLTSLISDPDATVRGLTAQAERVLSTTRLRIDACTRLYGRMQEHARRSAVELSAAHRSQRERIARELLAAQEACQAAEQEAATTSDELARAQSESPRHASLAILAEHGSRLGLVDQGCPLCGTTQTPQHFSEHVKSIVDQLAAANTMISAVARRSADAAARAAAARAGLERVSAQLAALDRSEAGLRAEFEALQRDARELGFDLPDVESAMKAVASAVDTQRDQATQIERAVAVLRASGAAERVTLLEGDLKRAQQELESAENLCLQANSAVHAASEALRAIRRVRGEYVNGQLAQLEPLLVELYQRLRPHVDWPQIQYRLRGDVRKLLRLEIGEGLNPSFVFSSGQRRAVGLAFLLALHLSRDWCAFDTLILDDPVQHIDDYRALHLTELLAAIRRTRRQVVCTVEDESLAKLLTRRLRSDEESAGTLVRMAYDSVDGIHIASVHPIRTMPRNLLIPA